ncbi:hypothetical protein, partial [uncultured Corynebacterium sp.]|uniref:hypothetical protein n=1 Tax=uncultured Corynebacterium sp. TaxID=159447 RepID=UPI0028065AB3
TLSHFYLLLLSRRFAFRMGALHFTDLESAGGQKVQKFEIFSPGVAKKLRQRIENQAEVRS